jgi:hypothetical protein
MATDSTRSVAAADLAADAFDLGDEALARTRATSPKASRSLAKRQGGTEYAERLTPADASSASAGDSGRPAGTARRASHASAEDAEHHYLNAASLYYTGAPRRPDSQPAGTINALPAPLRDALHAIYEDRNPHQTDSPTISATAAGAADRAARIRHELQRFGPEVFAGRDARDRDTGPMR